MSEAKIFRVVLTGGPCAGKTTALAEVAERLRSVGWRVIIVGETSTMFSNAGAGFPAKGTGEQMTNWEVAKIKTQIAIEEGYKAIAMDTGQNTVILHDRGTIDSKAYTDIDTWNKILKDNGWTEKSLGADRYDCVIHLVTAAIGAEQYYTTENNSARRESLEEAKLLDQRLQSVWSSHPHFIVIDNSTSFKEKIIRTIQAMCHILGVIPPCGSHQIYLVDNSILDKLTVIEERGIQTFNKFEVSYHFLETSSETENLCVRRRTENDVSTYTFSRTFTTPDGIQEVAERPISRKEYQSCIASSSSKMIKPFKKSRYAFIYDKQYFELDELPVVTIVTVEVPNRKSVVRFPEWLQEYVTKNVTGNKSYSLHTLATVQQNIVELVRTPRLSDDTHDNQ